MQRHEVVKRYLIRSIRLIRGRSEDATLHRRRLLGEPLGAGLPRRKGVVNVIAQLFP
jgi:hypothetical protein